jgi:hypothetical protein
MSLPLQNIPDQGVKVALYGDQGVGANPEAVLNLIKQENAELIVVAGDFEYTSNPSAWDYQLTNILG